MTFDTSSPKYKAGDKIGGFAVTQAVDLPRLAAAAYVMQHGKTGARYIHVASQDRENTFSVAFKTVPEDSTGVAHILEHTALCGSRSFPVRDPFFSMIKRSMNSFMNAFTSSDWTMYPFSTCNRKDFYNLMRVYLDASFFPLLEELSFKQEGFRVEEEAGALAFKGVVYNEMKGAMSSPRQIMHQALSTALYPDTTYGFNSGGDPEHIVSLTHEDLVAFHKRHYHPSNAFFYTYGDLPLEDHVKVMEQEVLRHFEPIDPRTAVALQPRWKAPREVHRSYPVAPDTSPSRKAQVALAWLACPATDSFEVLAADLLESVLLGNSASPLRKALMESGLGSSLSDGTGFDAENLDTMFSAGLKDVDDSDPGAIQDLILSTLKDLADKGIDRGLIDAAIHQYEFEKKEVTNAPYPYGLKLLLSFCGPWFHYGDPTAELNFDKDLDRLKQEVDQGGFFEKRIRELFLDNPHRVLLVLHPDPGMAADMEAAEKKKLEAVEAALTAKDRERIRADAAALEALQEKEEDISCLPTLGRGDIGPDVQTAHPDDSLGRPGISAYVQPTNGIVYFTLTAGVSSVPTELLPLVPLFCHVFPKMGSQRRSYVDLTRDMAAHTGGVGLGVSARTCYDVQGSSLEMVSLDTKCLDRNLDKTFAILEELLFERSFADLKRLDTLVAEYAAALDSSVVSNGHQYAISLCSRGYSRAKALEEAWHGIFQLQTIKAIAKGIAENKEQALKELSEKLEAIGNMVFTNAGVETGLVGEREVLAKAVAQAQAIHGKLPPGVKGPAAGAALDMPAPEWEAWTTSSSVSFVAHVFPTVRMAHEDAPVLAVIAKMLRSLFIHREIREKGGAYGGYALSNAEEGLFGFASYRDPHLKRTMDIFSQAFDFIREGKFSGQDVTEAVLQVCSDIDKPDAPSTLARKAFYRKLMGLSDEARMEFKKRTVSVTREQVLDAAQRWFKRPERLSPVVAVTSRSLLEKANAQPGGELKEIPIG